MRHMAMLVVLLLAGLVVPPAAAAPPWPTYPCYSGTLDAAASSATPDGPLLQVTAPGTVNCTVPAPGPRFAVAVFGATSNQGEITKFLTAEYSVTGPRSFETLGVIDLDNPSNQFPLALCLMSNEHSRLSCVRIDMDGRTGVVTQLSTEDPLVAWPITWTNNTPDPGCGSCWRIR